MTNQASFSQSALSHGGTDREDCVTPPSVTKSERDTRGGAIAQRKAYAACLALALERDLPALTAERRWPEIAEAIGVKVELIR